LAVFFIFGSGFLFINLIVARANGFKKTKFVQNTDEDGFQSNKFNNLRPQKIKIKWREKKFNRRT
jgi:hypothetical protein